MCPTNLLNWIFVDCLFVYLVFECHCLSKIDKITDSHYEKLFFAVLIPLHAVSVNEPACSVFCCSQHKHKLFVICEAHTSTHSSFYLKSACQQVWLIYVHTNKECACVAEVALPHQRCVASIHECLLHFDGPMLFCWRWWGCNVAQWAHMHLKGWFDICTFSMFLVGSSLMWWI